MDNDVLEILLSESGSVDRRTGDNKGTNARVFHGATWGYTWWKWKERIPLRDNRLYRRRINQLNLRVNNEQMDWIVGERNLEMRNAGWKRFLFNLSLHAGISFIESVEEWAVLV